MRLPTQLLGPKAVRCAAFPAGINGFRRPKRKKRRPYLFLRRHQCLSLVCKISTALSRAGKSRWRPRLIATMTMALSAALRRLPVSRWLPTSPPVSKGVALGHRGAGGPGVAGGSYTAAGENHGILAEHDPPLSDGRPGFQRSRGRAGDSRCPLFGQANA